MTGLLCFSIQVKNKNLLFLFSGNNFLQFKQTYFCFKQSKFKCEFPNSQPPHSLTSLVMPTFVVFRETCSLSSNEIDHAFNMQQLLTRCPWTRHELAFKTLGTLVLSSELTCISTSFRWKVEVQSLYKGLYNLRHTPHLSLQVKENLLFILETNQPTFAFQTNLFLVKMLQTVQN